MNKAQLDKAEAVIVDVLKKVRPELLKAHGNIEFVAKEDKTAVTELDKKVEELLREALREVTPDVGILGEEMGHEGNTDVYWVLDPIDGTEQYIRGMSNCRNLACLMEDGQPTWALMYAFVDDDLYLARKGEGMTINGKPFQIQPRPLDNCWIELMFDIEKPDQVEAAKRVSRLVMQGSKLHHFALFITGKMDGMVYMQSRGGLWDWGPRVLLYEEAGAKVAQLGYDHFDYTQLRRGLVAAHPDHFDALMRAATGK